MAEQDRSAIDGKLGEGRPQAEPSEAADEEMLVTEDVADTARNKAGNDALGYDTRSESSLSEGLRGADDSGKNAFAGKRLGAFDAGFRVV